MTDDRSIGCISVLLMIGIVLGGTMIYKSCAPQSAIRSRFGGEAAKLERPDDCKRVINMGKTSEEKYIVYETFEGDIKMKEFSDWGVLEGEYIVEKGALVVEPK